MDLRSEHDSPEWSVRLDDDLVIAVGDGQLEGALLVATLKFDSLIQRKKFENMRIRFRFQSAL